MAPSAPSRVGAVAFAATLILLFGFATLVLQSRDGGPVAASSTAFGATLDDRTDPDTDGIRDTFGRSLAAARRPRFRVCRARAPRQIRSSSEPATSPTARSTDDSATARLIEELGDSGTAPCH